MIYHVSLNIAGRDIAFSLDLDDNNLCDYGIIACLQSNKPCEAEVCQVLARALHEGDVAVDGGANVGFFTILMSKLVGETGKVYAFEPGGNNLPKLARNIALNNCNNVQVIDKPLSDTVWIAKLCEHEHGGYNSLWPDMSKDIMATRTVTTTTLEMELLGRVAPTLIKLDIEGAELAALKGTGALLRWQKPIIIVEMNNATLDRSGSTLDELRDYLQEADYEPFMLFSDGNLPAQIPLCTAIVPTRMNGNVMFTTVSEVEKLWPEVFI